MTNNATIKVTPDVRIDGLFYNGIQAWQGCTGPNPACRKAHAQGLVWHVIPSHPRNAGRDSYLIMPTYHYASLEEGVEAILEAEATAKEPASDEEWLRLEREGKVPFFTRAGMNHPTRR